MEEPSPPPALRLYFLRHGLADRSQWDGDDYHRPLTPEGRRRMELEAGAIAGLSLGVEVVVTSPLARAFQTAEIVAKVLTPEPRFETDEALSPGFAPPRLPELLSRYASARALMLVGHEPDFSRVVGWLTGGARVHVKKGSLVRVDLNSMDPPAGELVWLLPPKVLAR